MKKCPNCGAVVPEEMFHCEQCGHSFFVHEKPKRAPQAASIPARTRKWQRVLFVIVALSLIITFVRRLFPIEEMPRRSAVVLMMIIDLALTIALVGLGTRILRAIPKGTPGRGGWLSLFVAGIISLLGICAIHLSGGQRVEWQPRRSQAKTDALPADLKDRVSRIEGLLAAFKKAETDAENTRWVQTSHNAPAEIQKLSREDLREFLATQRAMLDAIDRILEYLAKPNLAADFNRVFSYAESRGITGGRKRPKIDPRPWRLLRQIFVADFNANKIIEENWEEWRLITSPPPEAERKPWQKEVDRLIAEREAAEKELKELPD